jgi:hypothetical protein
MNFFSFSFDFGSIQKCNKNFGYRFGFLKNSLIVVLKVRLNSNSILIKIGLSCEWNAN